VLVYCTKKNLATLIHCDDVQAHIGCWLCRKECYLHKWCDSECNIQDKVTKRPTEIHLTIKKIVDNAFISQVNTKTMHIKSIIFNIIAMISLKTLYPGGIRTRVFRRHAARITNNHFSVMHTFRDHTFRTPIDRFVVREKKIFFLQSFPQ
jgi:hypothetical protein